MEVNLTLAAVPALIGTVTGMGFAYLVFKLTISKWYGVERKTTARAKILYWGGIFCCVVMSQGSMQIMNELMYVLFNNSQIKNENIYKGIYIAIFLPIVFWIIIFLSSKLFKESSKQNIEVESSTTALTENNKKYLIAVLVLVPIISLLTFFGKDLQIGANEKTIEIKSCESCRNNQCNKTEVALKKIKIDETRVISYLEKNGELTILQRPDKDETCTIVKTDGFAFTCISKPVGNMEGVSQSFTTSYNGKEKYTWLAKFHKIDNELIYDKLSCEVIEK